MKDKYIELISKGYTSKQIAESIGQSTSTVKRNLISLGLKTLHKRETLTLRRDILEKYIESDHSTYEIADILKCSQSSVKHWLKKFGLKTHPKWQLDRDRIKEEIESGFKTCPKCDIKKPIDQDNFYIKKNGKFHHWCRNCNDKISLEKQTERKQMCVDYKGGKCIKCGYNKYIGSLDFHHVNPNEKKFNISNLRTYSFDVLKSELDKCVLLCRNCHGELHGGVISL